MNADVVGMIRAAGADFDSAFREALRAALDSTGLEGRSLAWKPGGGKHAPWLQKAGGDGNAGYWAECELSPGPPLPARAWPVRLRVTYMSLASDGRLSGSSREQPTDLTVTGRGASDCRVLAAVTVAVVLGHQRDLARRAA